MLASDDSGCDGIGIGSDAAAGSVCELRIVVIAGRELHEERLRTQRNSERARESDSTKPTNVKVSAKCSSFGWSVVVVVALSDAAAVVVGRRR